MVNAKIEVDGFKELETTLREFGDRVFDNALGKAVQAGSKPILAIAESRVPVDSGLTKESLGCVVRKYPQSHTVIAVIGPRGSVVGESHGKKHVPARIAHLIENGHRTIQAGKGEQSRAIRKELRTTRKGGDKVGADALSAKLDSLSSGFVQAQPFMRPAADEGKDQAAQKIKEVLTQEIYREIEK